MKWIHRGPLTVAVVAAALGAVVCLAGSGTGSTAQPETEQTSILAGKTKFNFVAFGDIRFTNPANTRVSNPGVRRALVKRIAELKPEFVVLTGDLVLRGATVSDWQVWDSETKPWTEAGLRIFPVLGNHDIADDPTATNYFEHFGDLHRQRWYTVRAGNTLLLMLDSEADAPGGEQWKWLQDQLSNIPADVDFIFVVVHHPPYTHSSPWRPGGGHAARPSEEQLARLLEQRQGTTRARMIVLAGHVHNYERYEHGEVTYIVTGGGGATPYVIERTSSDPYRESGPAYHFVRFVIDGRRLRAEMVKMEGQSQNANWPVRDSFQLEAAAAAPATAQH